MVHRTVLKVDVSCLKCKKKLLQTVSALQGVDKIEVDEGKGTLTVTGNADPYDIVVCTRKARKHAEVVSIGPPPAPPPPKQDAQKKPEEKKPDQKAQLHNPHTCPRCQRIAVVPVTMTQCDDVSPYCSIM